MACFVIKLLKTFLMKKLSTILFILCCITLSFSQGIPPREEVNLNAVYAQYNLSGDGVVVVMIDRGIDYRHPDFIDENGNTRIAYIYDMIDPTGAGSNPYGIGTIFDENQINASLSGGGAPLSTDRGGHGTATTGIAAGDGSGTMSGDFQGVAPKATIISIKITHDPFPPFAGNPGQAGFFNPAYVAVALQFAADKIAELGMPSVTLMNLGSIGGPTDGTSIYCQAIENFIALGNPFVCGVGDDGGADNHAAGTINQGQTVEIDIEKGEVGFLRFDLWYSEDDRFTVRIERPNGTEVGPFTAPTGPNDAVDQNFGDITMFHRGADTEFWGATSNRRELMIDFSGATGTYKVKLEGASISSGAFNATLNPSVYYNTNRFNNFIVPGFSINDYASAPSVITPTDYVVQNDWIDINGVFRDKTGEGEAGELWLGSSEGPTQDNRRGIDFATPGEVCHAAYADNTYYENFAFNVLQGSNGLYGIQNAVSAAAPLATGVIALMLEAVPTLTPAQIKSDLQQSAVGDNETGSVPNNTWGYGKLDALLAIENALGVSEQSSRATTVFPNPVRDILHIQSNNNLIAIDIRDAQGRIILSQKNVNGVDTVDLSNLNAGLYFITLISGDASSATHKIIKN